MNQGGEGMSSMTKQKIKAHKTMVAFMGGLIMLVTSNIAMAALSQN
jgi:hypothetical protein